MQRWNGWGDPSVTMELPEQGAALLKEVLGEGTVQDDYRREDFLKKIPKSRLRCHRSKRGRHQPPARRGTGPQALDRGREGSNRGGCNEGSLFHA